jgi:hypothetical protein
MKKLVMTAVCLASINASAVEKCYQATNPKSITITRDANARQGISEIVEIAVAAQVKLETESKQVQEDGYTYTVEPHITLEAQSKNLKFLTVANQNQGTKNEYGVDCDGGRVTVTKTKKGLVLNSERLNGDVTAGSEGCSAGSVVFKNLKVTEKSCH